MTGVTEFGFVFMAAQTGTVPGGQAHVKGMAVGCHVDAVGNP
jgi:hypothetical protein